MHALHATLVHRGVLDELIWARLPPDHSHEEIDSLFFTIKEWLKLAPEFGAVSELIKCLRAKLASSDWANCAVFQGRWSYACNYQ
eukprot:2539188-Pleurochrysis_carterae.AAC.1